MLTSKTKKTMRLLRKLQHLLPLSALLTIYEALLRPHFDYGDIIYEKACNAT